MDLQFGTNGEATKLIKHDKTIYKFKIFTRNLNKLWRFKEDLKQEIMQLTRNLLWIAAQETVIKFPNKILLQSDHLNIKINMHKWKLASILCFRNNEKYYKPHDLQFVLTVEPREDLFSSRSNEIQQRRSLKETISNDFPFQNGNRYSTPVVKQQGSNRNRCVACYFESMDNNENICSKAKVTNHVCQRRINNNKDVDSDLDLDINISPIKTNSLNKQKINEKEKLLEKTKTRSAEKISDKSLKHRFNSNFILTAGDILQKSHSSSDSEVDIMNAPSKDVHHRKKRKLKYHQNESGSKQEFKVPSNQISVSKKLDLKDDPSLEKAEGIFGCILRVLMTPINILNKKKIPD